MEGKWNWETDVRAEEEHNEGVPLSVLAVLPFHHLLRKREEAAPSHQRVDEEVPAVTL